MYNHCIPVQTATTEKRKTDLAGACVQVASLVAVLKVARQLQLVRDLDVVNIPGFPPVPIPEHLLQQAICHSNEALLVDAMTLACVHPKTTAMPGKQCGSHLNPITLIDN